MKKSIILSIASVMAISSILTSCGKKTDCVCEIDGQTYTYDLSSQSGATRKASCDAMKVSMNFTGSGTCKLK